MRIISVSNTFCQLVHCEVVAKQEETQRNILFQNKRRNRQNNTFRAELFWKNKRLTLIRLMGCGSLGASQGNRSGSELNGRWKTTKTNEKTNSSPTQIFVFLENNLCRRNNTGASSADFEPGPSLGFVKRVLTQNLSSIVAFWDIVMTAPPVFTRQTTYSRRRETSGKGKIHDTLHLEIDKIFSQH